MKGSAEVNRQEFAEALSTIRRTTDKAERGEAIMTFEDEALVVHCGGASARAGAEGEWPGRLRVSSSALLGLGEVLPEENPLPVQVTGDKLRIGSVSISCTWDETERELVAIPMNANLLRLLQVDQQYPDDVLEGSGLAMKIEEARQHSESLLDEAVETLAPLGITREDLVELLQSRLESDEEVDTLIGPDQQRLPIEVEGEQLSLGD